MHRLPPPRWTVADAIDFEHLLAVDEGRMGDEATAFVAAHPAAFDGPADRASVFLAWTRFVRERTAGPLPGELYRRARWLAAALLGVSGFVVGATLAGSLLARRDAEPVNALIFLGCTVGLQVAFLVVVGLAAALRAAGASVGPMRETSFAIVKLIGRAVNRLDGERRSALQARWATLDLRAERLGPLFACDLLIVTQRFAMAFNAGLLAAMLLVYLPFEELRFGWQSTYSFTAGGVATAVRAIAAPWSWLSPALVPDELAIVATRYARGQRADTLPADAAHAWWPFLLAAIVVHGFAVRALLAALGWLVLRRRLAHVDWTQPAANGLWRRFTGPLMQPSGGTGRLPSDRAGPGARPSGGIDLLVVDREWDVDVDVVRDRIERRFDGPVGRLMTATVDDDVLPDALVGALQSAASVAVATAASRDPIVAVAGFLDALSARSRDGALTVILLPDGATAVSDERIAIWRRFAAIQRLRVGIERAP